MSAQVFKPGDRVRSRGWWNYNATATVVEIVPGYPNGLTVHVDLDRPVENQTRAAFEPSELELLP